MAKINDFHKIKTHYGDPTITGCNEEETSQTFRRVPAKGFREQREPKTHAIVNILFTVNGDNMPGLN